jgi:N-acetylglucosamine malate deacetylase 1
VKLLALGAHPDDIEIFMFGALAAWRDTGAALAFGIATDGALGGAAPDLPRLRMEEARAAAALLGVEPHFLGFPDGGLAPDRDLVAALKRLIGAEQPDLIVTHAANDYHGDHRALAMAVAIAASFTAPVLQADTLGGVGFVPTIYVDVTAHFNLKAQAIRAHASQDPERFVAAAARLNAFRAGQCNGGDDAFAEAYATAAVFPFADIRNLLPPAPPVRPVADRGR